MNPSSDPQDPSPSLPEPPEDPEQAELLRIHEMVKARSATARVLGARDRLLAVSAGPGAAPARPRPVAPSGPAVVDFGTLVTKVCSHPAGKANQRSHQARQGELEQESLAVIARQRGVPSHEGTLAVVLAQEVQGEAIEVLSAAVERREQAQAEGRRVPLILVASGDVDTGKTAAGARLVARHPRTARYIRAADLPDPDAGLVGIAFALQESVDALRREVRDVDLLVIDEVDPRRLPLVAEWASVRFDVARATILLGNVTSQALADPRVVDRRLLSRLERQPQEIAGRWLIPLGRASAQMSRRPLPR